MDDTGASPVLYYIHTDQLGSPQKITDASLNIDWDGVFDPFGNVASLTGSLTNNLRFPGQYLDAETALNQNWNRDYDPTIGRYIQSDPIGLLGGINRYIYAGNNPISSIDQSGLYHCTYSISAHSMSCVPDNPNDPPFYSSNYVSGNNLSPNCPDCQNNPDRTNVQDHGPAPAGGYTIGGRTGNGGRRHLIPDPGTPMDNRDNMETHGCPDPATCSNGCIAATDNATRDLFNNDMDLEANNSMTVTQ